MAVRGRFSASLGLVVVFFGCGAPSTPPGPTTIGTSAPGMNITYLGWKEGLRILFVDDVKGSHQSGGAGTTTSTVHKSVGGAGSGQTSYQWQIEATGGTSAKCQINGKEYDLSKGSVFVIKAKDEDVGVHQLQRDLSAIALDTEGCRDPIQNDAEIRKLLGLSNR